MVQDHLFSQLFAFVCVSEQGEERGSKNRLGKSLVLKTDDTDEKHSAETARERQIGTMSLIKCHYHKMGFFFLSTLFIASMQ